MGQSTLAAESTELKRGLCKHCLPHKENGKGSQELVLCSHPTGCLHSWLQVQAWLLTVPCKLIKQIIVRIAYVS